MTDSRLRAVSAEVLTQSTPDVDLRAVSAEVLTQTGAPDVRLGAVSVETLIRIGGVTWGVTIRRPT